MEAKAVAKYVRISPKKARQVARLIKGKGVDEALAILQYTPRKAARLIAKVLRSAVANAENNLDLDRDDLYVAKSYVDEGPPFKRIRPRARGMANRILRRTSHITVVVKEREED